LTSTRRIEKAAEQKRNATILSKAPRLTDWLRNRENALVARDDLGNLSWFEALGQQGLASLKGPPAGAVTAMGIFLEDAGQLARPANPAVRLPLAKRIPDAKGKSPEEIAALRQEIWKQGDINPTVAQSIVSAVLSGDMTSVDALAALEPLFEPALKVASEALQSGGQAVQDYTPSILPARPGFEDGRQIGEGLGSLGALLATSLLPGGIFTAGAMAGASGAGDAAANARKAGKDEDTQTIAALYGIAPGLLDIIPMDRLLNNPVTKKGFASILRSIGVQFAQEATQEATQEVMQNAIAKYLYAPDQGMFKA
jgi:hypothetical protein